MGPTYTGPMTRTGPGLGVAAGAVTLGVAELLSGLFSRVVAPTDASSPLLAVGATVVDLTPAWLKEWAISTFGTADKAVLLGCVLAVLALASAAVGSLAVRHLPAGLAAGSLVGALGAAAVLTRPDAGVGAVVPTVVGVLVGLGTLVWGVRRWSEGSAPPERANRTGRPSRREFLVATGGLTAVGVLGVVGGRALGVASQTVQRAREAFRVPAPSRAIAVPADAEASVAGQSAYLTPTKDFYRIDTALSVPRVEASDWRLRVYGLVDREIELTYADLLAEQHVEALVTLTCVSNPVGGDLVGNARWQGWPVRELLARAGVRPEADMVLSRSVDGWTAGTPLAALTDDRDALLAVAMNGDLLPLAHGFPVRLVVPGLYGYVSATKWVTELKVSRFDADEGYWTPRGWSALGPIKTASRIDVPRAGAAVPEGDVVVAGVAWAQQRGVARVEVAVDGGAWSQATLAGEPTIDAWRLWSWTWRGASRGLHTLAVRATDGLGETQTADPAPPAPDGATGWHTIDVRVG